MFYNILHIEKLNQMEEKNSKLYIRINDLNSITNL